MGRLAEKRAFVTAAGAGIGRATALAFAREGALVTATDIDEDALASLKQEAPAIATARLDVRDGAAVAAALAGAAPDILFNCAGFVHHGTILEMGDSDWEFSWDLNVTSMVRTIRAALPGMLERGSGTIINMASVASSIRGVPNRFAYGATKAAVIGLTKAIAADYVAAGIRAHAICPGTVESPSLEGRINAQPDPVAARAAFIARQPMGRLGKPEEVAVLAVYLASEEASYTTGQPHIIDGGWSN
ncbi:SDR family oxidoreductase [Alterisphingorhabdus coralli]|uniref:SDR family oxidoreductase n=1 Tax=Alterisphingorhabdus coralli TaxID=3071408 RepID=A0AA97F994_9SPHN|nr:SDR family oxidoreductase [Parasphingorhabdus sp. SCSIO 66989]WOE75638.1 SDR family oxidoreductase [Parasphingorhabdus sp. SCSIO 66989]